MRVPTPATRLAGIALLGGIVLATMPVEPSHRFRDAEHQPYPYVMPDTTWEATETAGILDGSLYVIHTEYAPDGTRTGEWIEGTVPPYAAAAYTAQAVETGEAVRP